MADFRKFVIKEYNNVYAHGVQTPSGICLAYHDVRDEQDRPNGLTYSGGDIDALVGQFGNMTLEWVDE